MFDELALSLCKEWKLPAAKCC